MSATKVLSALAATLLVSSGAANAQSAGAQVYAQHCAMCHQPGAEGMAGLAPPLKSAQWSKFAAQGAYITNVPLSGMSGTLKLADGTFSGVMPTQNRLSDTEIASVLNYLVREVNAIDSWHELNADDIAVLRNTPLPASRLRAMRQQAIEK